MSQPERMHPHPSSIIWDRVHQLRAETSMLQLAIQGIITSDDHAELSDAERQDAITGAFDCAFERIKEHLTILERSAEELRQKGVPSLIENMAADAARRSASASKVGGR